MKRRQKTPISDDPVPGSLGVMLPRYREEASRFVKELGFNIDDASSWIRSYFESTIIAKYRSTFEGKLESHPEGDLVGLAIKLAKDKGTRSRWEKGERQPDWNTLFLGLAACDVDIGPSIPRGREVVIGAVCTTVPMLRVKYLHGIEDELSEHQLVCLHYVTQCKAWSHASETQKPKHWQAALEFLRPRISRFAPKIKLDTCDDVLKNIQGWTLPWCVFHYLMPHNWQYEEQNDGTTS